MAKRSSIFIIFLVLILSHPVDAKKLRFISSAGFSMQNEIANDLGFAGGAGLHIAYPVTPRTRFINTEISIANWYHVFPNEADFLQTFKFGFGIRIFLNVLKKVRPYFTHDITSQFVWLKSEESYTPTFGILLGLGIDIPISKDKDKKKETSSIFFDVAYNFFKIRYFNENKSTVRYLTFNVGYSFNIRKIKRKKSENASN